MARPIYTAHLRHARWLSDQTRHFEFAVKELPRFDFAAGQFISMLTEKDGRQVTRAYSIASGPRGDNTFDLCLNRVELGFFSNLLCDLDEGLDISFHGPHGHFTLHEPLRDSIFIATGTGVAPMRGFVEWIFSDPARHAGRRLWLVFGTRYDKDVYYQQKFERLAAQNPNFKYLVTISRPSEAWPGRKGYVQEMVREILEPMPAEQRAQTDAYICGLGNMVTANRQLLSEMGFEKKQINFERYD